MRFAHKFPQTRDLAAFAAVVEGGGFATAGRRLGVAPSTLSRTVTRLEALLGVTLLRRSTRAIELTPEGRQLLEAAQENLRQTEALLDIAQGSRTPRGPLRVARFSDYMVADELAAGRLVELVPGQLDTPPLDITAPYLTRTSGLQRLAVSLDWLREVLPGRA